MPAFEISDAIPPRRCRPDDVSTAGTWGHPAPLETMPSASVTSFSISRANRDFGTEPQLGKL